MRYRVIFRNFELMASIGFHDFERVEPQRLLINAEIELDMAHFPTEDHKMAAWDYDFFRHLVHDLVDGRHFELQETLCRKIFDDVVHRPGVLGARIATAKPDVYQDVEAVGCEISTL